ncbi:MAG: glycosyltransferase family 4 protein [Planctomycetota bacterium]|nr:glycosyltransferase family 4 protein [Planctomycetota bacterium]
MNVALALFRYFPHGGMQRDLVATARALRARGHEVRVFCHTLDEAPPADVAVEVLPVAGRSNHARARAFAAALRARLAESPADVVVGFDKMPGLDLYFAADPCYVERTRRRPWPYRLTARYRTFRALERAVFGPGGPRVMLLDDRERARYQRVYGSDQGQFVALPPGVARDRRRPEDAATRRARARTALGVNPDDFVLLLLASNYRLKGLDRALRALRRLPSELLATTRLVAVGEGSSARWSREVTRLGLEHRCSLLAGRDDIPALLQAADLLVHPARRDTTATVLMEAAVAGLPSLCTDACGYASRVREAGAGVVLTEPFDQGDLDEALRTMRRADLTPYRDAALRYADAVDLHSMHARVVDEVERCATRP